MLGYIVDIFLIISNVAFVWPAVVAWQWGVFLQSYIYQMVVFASSSYHLCDSYNGLCIFSFNTHQRLDFIFATSVIPLTAINLIYFRLGWVQKWLKLFAITLIALLEVSLESSTLTQAIVCGGSIALLLIYWFGWEWGRITRIYDWYMLALGMALSIMSVSFFLVQGFWPAGYWVLHSYWHICGAVGQQFFIKARAPAPHRLNLDAPIVGTRQKDGKLTFAFGDRPWRGRGRRNP